MRYFTIILILFITTRISGQLFPLSDFYLFNGLVINPAYAGSDDALSTSIQYRNQWIGIKDAPKNGMLSAHAPFFNDRMGLGILLTRNSSGIFNETSIMGNYAYRMNMYNGKLSLGLAFGITTYRLSWKDLEPADPDDQVLIHNSSRSMVPDFSLGAYYEGRNYFAGISLPFFLNYKANDRNGKFKAKNEPEFYNYFITGGYIFDINDNLSLKPSLLVTYNAHTKMQGDFYLQLEISERLSTGAGIRSTGMFIGLLSCNINKQLRVSYSFDTDSGKAGSYRKGSHEIMIGYIFRYTRNVMSPAEI